MKYSRHHVAWHVAGRRKEINGNALISSEMLWLLYLPVQCPWYVFGTVEMAAFHFVHFLVMGIQQGHLSNNRAL